MAERVTHLTKGKAINILEQKEKNLFLAAYEDVITTEKGTTNLLLVRRVVLIGELHWVFHSWYYGEDDNKRVI